MATQLGFRLMPWQLDVAEVLGEVNEFGVPYYREAIVAIPRQSGKTTFNLAAEVERCIMWTGRRRVTYTAQTGKDAREKLLQDQVPIIRSSSIWRAFGGKITEANGQEAIVFKDGSRIGVQASSETAGHGKTLDLGVIDEAFSDQDDAREQAMLPAMLTKPDAQLLVVSTAGTEKSVYWNRKVEQGREAVEAGATSGIAYFEWSAHPDEDPDDPDTWIGCMPALGITINEAAVRHARATMPDGEFRRAMLNQPTIAVDRLIPVAVWQAVISDKAAPSEPFSFALEVAPDRSSAALAVAGPNRVVEVIEHCAGLEWIGRFVADLAKQDTVRVTVDGPSVPLTPELRSAGATVLELPSQGYEHACSRFHDALSAGSLAIRRPVGATLDSAAAAVHRRTSGDKWIYDRQANADVSPLIAAVIAFDAAIRATEVEPWIKW